MTEAEIHVLAFDSSMTDTGAPGDDAAALWGAFIARNIETNYEKHVFSTPGVLEALDVAIEEIEDMKPAP